ncbi:RICIN domain-containing protein [Streptomyces sp. UNOB3_S3]|uniref:RICIN domain-containing protein n=1 Tax=Streptomyces sp. UNOB3_S3 TaxID=2871682 RepID=UPI001E2EAED2|nr:RICIN domain-containing protein [Streptomyces sp. UNOB3_S3]MCC3776659.1 ricin-type beta-trefoil lectin domain protein [Streptomyces sp. UNOB3_S3]
MHRHLKGVSRLIGAPFLALLLLTTGIVAISSTAQAADSDAWTFATANGRRLDAQNGNTGDGVFVVANNTPGYHQEWRLIPLGNGEFQVANNFTGKCLSEGFPLTQQSCGKKGQEWHFRPVTGKTNTFMLVRSSNDRCLDIALNAQYSDAWTQVYGCNGTAAQQWAVPATRTPEAMKLAVEYYSHLCSTNTSTCSWKQTSEGAPEALPREKASSVWYNDTSDKVTQVFTTIYHSGWAQSLSVGLSASLGVSNPVQAMISQQLTATTVYTSDESTINGVAVTVPPKQYGWVDFAAVAKKVTGTWTFDKGRFSWTADATVTVPVVSSPVGSTMYIAHTGTTPPGITPPAGDPAGGGAMADTFVTAVSKTYAPPADTHLAAYGNGVKFTDDKGTTLGTVLPGEFTDTEGKTHGVRLSVSGNTVTQTIADAPGDTIKGTMAPPVFSLGGAQQSVSTASTPKGALASPLASFGLSQVADGESANHKTWRECMKGKMSDGMIYGGIGGAAGGLPGAATGFTLGVIAGYFAGRSSCGPEPKD